MQLAKCGSAHPAFLFGLPRAFNSAAYCFDAGSFCRRTNQSSINAAAERYGSFAAEVPVLTFSGGFVLCRRQSRSSIDLRGPYPLTRIA